MIMSEIAAGSCRSDLCRFRLVTQECRSLSEKSFAQRNFASRRHSIDVDSLETLVEISKHPVFAPYLKTIRLSTFDNSYDDTEGTTARVGFSLIMTLC